MTQEEKARAYDEALEDIRVIYPNLRGDAKLAVEHAFPELAESEDERIRKTLLEYFNERNSYRDEDETFNGVSFSSIIAYLEKQKEQKPTIELVFPKFRVGDIIRSVRDKWNKTTRRISHVGEHGYNFDYRHLGDKVSGGSFGFSFEDDYELVEQKPAEWSEGDENILWNIISIVGESKSIQADEMLDWLKALRPQPKQEWSEEDNDFINMLILHFNYLIDKGGDSVETYKTYRERLKSLRPSWKPSEQEKKH